jgi:hypothetical protein
LKIAVVVDTGFGDDKTGLIYHAVNPPSMARSCPVV